MSDRPPIPEGIKRALRQEAYFGCVFTDKYAFVV